MIAQNFRRVGSIWMLGRLSAVPKGAAVVTSEFFAATAGQRGCLPYFRLPAPESLLVAPNRDALLFT
jgi:hypothetical protein